MFDEEELKAYCKTQLTPFGVESMQRSLSKERALVSELQAEVKELKKRRYSEQATVKDVMAKPDDYLERWIDGKLNELRDLRGKLAAKLDDTEQARQRACKDAEILALKLDKVMEVLKWAMKAGEFHKIAWPTEDLKKYAEAVDVIRDYREGDKNGRIR